MKQHNADVGRKVPFLLALAITLQDMTNWLFGRRFNVGLGVLKNKGPAVFLEIRKGYLFKQSESLVMDVKTFVELALEVASTPSDKLEREGFSIPKRSMMDKGFHIPTWSFPRATLEIVIAAKEILAMYKSYERTLNSMTGVLKEAGLADEEIKKFREHALKALPGKEEPAKDEKQQDKPTLH